MNTHMTGSLSTASVTSPTCLVTKCFTLSINLKYMGAILPFELFDQTTHAENFAAKERKKG